MFTCDVDDRLDPRDPIVIDHRERIDQPSPSGVAGSFWAVLDGGRARRNRAVAEAMKNTRKRPKKHRGGRPRSATNTELIAALIGRQDQFTDRRRRQLAELRARYVDTSIVAAERIEARRILLERMLQIPVGVGPSIAATSDPGSVFRILDEALRQGLTDVADAYEKTAAAIGDAPAALPPLRPSTSLAQARARAAAASTELAHFRDRIRASGGKA